MKNIITYSLFLNMTEDEILTVLEKGNYHIGIYEKGNEIYRLENKITHTGLILDGEIDVIQITANGDEEIVGRNASGDLIGPSYCITGLTNSTSHFRAHKHTKILFIDINAIISSPSEGSYYAKFIANTTNILANTNILLTKKIQLLTQKSLREKLLTYFFQLSEKYASSSFVLSFTREQLAHYICSERSSVCRELGRMQDEGIITVEGNNITLLN